MSIMNIFRQFIDIIYPPRCHICHKFLWENRVKKVQQELLFCQPCFDGFSVISSPRCPICGTPFVSETEEDHLCEDCLRKRPFYDAVGAPYLYEGNLMAIIHEFKYAGKSYLANALGPLLGSFAKGWLNRADDCLMMPVPLHSKRLRERGFNQSLHLARKVAPLLGTELDFLSLRRVRYTRPQTGLKSDERRKNVRKAFEVLEKKAVKSRTVILVDDVTTTGHTLNECARVLKRSGSEDVFGLVLARTLGV
jgi:ComF family protein